MGFPRRREILVDAHVQLLPPALEPHPAARAHAPGLRQLAKAEQVPVEAPGLGLAARRRRDLEMIEAEDLHARPRLLQLRLGARYFPRDGALPRRRGARGDRGAARACALPGG